jgi:hypothetical protein
MFAYIEKGVWGKIWWGLGIGIVLGVLGALIGGLVENKLFSIKIFKLIFFLCIWAGILIEGIEFWFVLEYLNQ